MESVIHDFPLPDQGDILDGRFTETIIASYSNAPDARTRFLLTSLVKHMHAYLAETRLTDEERHKAIRWLIALTHDEKYPPKAMLHVLCDILGISTAIETRDYAKPPGATEGTVLGPFHLDASELKYNGDKIIHDDDGEPLLVTCTVKDLQGRPIQDAIADVWQSDSHGHYDLEKGQGLDGRAIINTDDMGRFWFNTVIPEHYSVPTDCVLDTFFKASGRHPWRPSHIHLQLRKDNYESLTTALHPQNDCYLGSDAAFGVRKSLVIEIGKATAEVAKTYNVAPGTRYVHYDFVLPTQAEAHAFRVERAKQDIEKLGRKWTLDKNGLPVVDVD